MIVSRKDGMFREGGIAKSVLAKLETLRPADHYQLALPRLTLAEMDLTQGRGKAATQLALRAAQQLTALPPDDLLRRANLAGSMAEDVAHEDENRKPQHKRRASSLDNGVRQLFRPNRLRKGCLVS